MGTIKLAIAISYTIAVIASLVIGFVAVPRDLLNFIFVVVLGLPWTLLVGHMMGDAMWFSMVVMIGSVAFNAGVLWWWTLRSRWSSKTPELRAG
jgi:hypothetical protein